MRTLPVCPWIKKADINATNPTDPAPLYEAIKHSKTRIAELLRNRGGSVAIHDDKHWTPLHQTADRGNAYLIDFFLDEGREYCDVEDKASDNTIWGVTRFRHATSLFLVSGNGKEAAIKALIN